MKNFVVFWCALAYVFQLSVVAIIYATLGMKTAAGASSYPALFICLVSLVLLVCNNTDRGGWHLPHVNVLGWTLFAASAVIVLLTQGIDLELDDTPKQYLAMLLANVIPGLVGLTALAAAKIGLDPLPA